MPDISMNSNPEQLDDNNNNTEVSKKLEELNLGQPDLEKVETSSTKSDSTIEAAPEPTGSGDAEVVPTTTTTSASASDSQPESSSPTPDKAATETTSPPESTTSPTITSNTAMDGEYDKDPEQAEPVEKHALNSNWTLWFMNGDNKSQAPPTGGKSDWQEKLIKLYTFGTVEDLWSLFNHVQQPAKLRVKNDYMLFREGVVPQGEDINNVKGGSWNLVLPSKMRNENLDRLWLETVLSLIGEMYGDCGDQIMGCYLQRRQKEDRIQVWTSEADKADDVKDIGMKLKEHLNLTQDSPLQYSKHEDTYGADPNRRPGTSCTSRKKIMKTKKK
jgi:translation initiation factor 4E